MPITLDATVAGAASNSYATLTQANALAVTEIGASAAAWVAGVDDEAKKRALITATREIDSIPSLEVDFIGDRATDTQRLEFPRDDDPTALPQRLVAATIELAIVYLADSTSDVLNPVPNDKRRVRSGDDEVEWFAAADKDADSLDRFPAIVQRLLGPLLVWLVTSGWGSGKAVRAS